MHNVVSQLRDRCIASGKIVNFLLRGIKIILVSEKSPQSLPLDPSLSENGSFL